MVSAVEARHGKVDVLVNNVGWTSTGSSSRRTREEWEKEVQLNLWGMINCTRAVLDGMIEKKGGVIVSMGSDAGRMGEFREAVYGACKAGIIALSKSLAREVGRHGIRLNVVCPGMTIPESDEDIGGLSMWAQEPTARSRPGDEGADREGLSAPPHRATRGRGAGRPLPRLGCGELRHRPDAQRQRRLHDDVNDVRFEPRQPRSCGLGAMTSRVLRGDHWTFHRQIRRGRRHRPRRPESPAAAQCHQPGAARRPRPGLRRGGARPRRARR